MTTARQPEGQPPAAQELTLDQLAAWPLPGAPAAGDKEARGQVLVIAGSREMPGAAILAARAALRAGAGKLCMAVPADIAAGIALRMDEARVLALPQTPAGGLAAEGAALLQDVAPRVSAVLIGPGMLDACCIPALLRAALPMFSQATVVLDALAMEVVHEGQRFTQPVVLTPHAGEMAGLTGAAKDEVLAQPERHAREAAERWGAVVALKGPTTCIAAPDGRAWRHCAHVPGLGTSGSGDVLAGMVAGFAARGAPAEQAALWGVAAHARCGQMLARRHGTVGYLASEICEMLPRVLRRMPGGQH